MLNERKAENRRPSDGSQTSQTGGKGVNEQVFKDMVGNAIRRTMSQYDSLLRYGLDHELGQIVQEYDIATADIPTHVAQSVKDRLIKMIHEEVRRSFDKTLFGAEGSLSDPMWLRAANKQWRAEPKSSGESHQPSSGEVPTQPERQQEEPTSEEAHRDDGHYKYRMTGVPPFRRQPQNVEVQQPESQQEEEPPSEEAYPDDGHYKYRMAGVPPFRRQPERVEAPSPHDSDAMPSARSDESERLWPVPEEARPQFGYEPEIPSQTGLSEILDTSIVHVEDAAELPVAQEVALPQQVEQPEDLAQSESSETALTVQERPTEITPPSSSFWVLPGVEDREDTEVEDDEFTATNMLPQPLPEEVEEVEEEYEAETPQSALPEAMEYDEVWDTDASEASEEELDTVGISAEADLELPQEEVFPEEAWSGDTVNAVLDDIGYFKTVVHDSNEIVHIAPNEEAAVAEEVAHEVADEDEFEPHDEVTQAIAVTESEDDVLAAIEEEPQEIAETPEDAEELTQSDTIAAELVEQYEEEEGTAIDADDLAVEAAEQEVDVLEVSESAEQSEDVEEKIAEPISEQEEPAETAVAPEEAEQLDEAEEDLAETWAEDDDLTEIVDDDEELTEETVTKVMFEGTVRLNVEANGCIKEIVHFVRELRQKPQLRLLRLVGNNKMGVDIWLGLREPLRLKAMLPELEGVSIVTKPLPHVGSPNERLLSVRLSPLPDSLLDNEEEAQEVKEAEPVGAVNS